MSGSSKFLDVDSLGQLVYERSKLWATFINDVQNSAQNEEEDGIDFSDLEEYLEIDNEEKFDSNEAVEDNDGVELEDEEILRDITNQKIIVRKRPSTPNDSVNNDDANKSQSKLMDFLNETKPIFLEHERQWKEAGLDLVVNSFDPEKIEEKVGSWLRRNQSVSSTTGNVSNFGHRNYYPSDDSDSDSLNSGDTARYILSSRKRQYPHSRSIGSCAIMTTIKTFRLVKSKREELRRKYACDNLDVLQEENIYKRLGHGRLRHPYNESVDRNRNVHSSRDFGLAMESRTIKRHDRHKLVKRRPVGSRSSDYSSFEEHSLLENTEYRRVAPGHGKSVLPCKFSMSANRAVRPSRRGFVEEPYQTFCYGRGSHNDSKSSSFEMKRQGGSVKNRHRLTVRNEDRRPSKRESDCYCRGEDTLCNHVRHIADSSTDEWLVENLSSSKKCTQKTKNIRSSRKTDSKNLTSGVSPLAKKLLLTNAGSSKHDVDSKSTQCKKKQKVANSTKKKVEKKRAIEVVEEAENDDSFEEQLKKVIEESKKTYEAETKRMMKKKPPKGKNNSNNNKVTPGNQKELQKPVKSSTKGAKKPSTAPRESKREENPRKIASPGPAPSENTFLSHAKNICNSTALVNHTAAKRQSFERKNSDKALVNDLSSSASSTNLSSDDDKGISNDCTVITSTTADNVVKRSSPLPLCTPSQAPAASHKPTKPHHHLGQQTSKGILVYTPRHRSFAPSQSFIGDSFVITEDYMSSIIGQEDAKKFMKFYIGRKHFNSNSTIYFRPSQAKCIDSDDELDVFGNIGDLHESMNSFVEDKL